MKTTSKIAARRVIQGGAAFAALGALSIATALPAAADVEQYGWGYAASLGGAGFVETQDGTSADSFSVDYGWVSLEGTTSSTVNASGVSSTVQVSSIRIQITVADVEGDLEIEDEEDDEEKDEETEEPTEEPSPSEDQAPEEQEGDDTSGEGDTDEPAPTTPPADEDDETVPSPEPSESPSATPEAEEADEALAPLVLDETNSDLVDGSDEVLVEATISGVSVTTTQKWDGSVDRQVNEGSVNYITVPEGTDFSLTPEVIQWEEPTEFEGYVWDDAYTVLDYNMIVDDELVDWITVAETGAGILTIDEDGDNGGGDGDGEEKPRPEKPAEKPAEKEPAAKPSEALATTGSPIGGLIAAGAAIAAGGGAAAYLARRKKTATEAPAEENGDN
ncbi:hypothetical protein [Nocardiopsis lambiniae]|uniref:LPXTG cell wall anchor domain-containing protein n=1 Tax=Nocardiopsis lambiniae TaxID=3075539 RepID=A0ABU2M7G7_9ACTN|nr:hypothetical protein [Nocardiopsis sp. DSM 44743]MDT0328181.1 hypothetical protein [Nocardiopsis sp. DSM 44743]